MKIFSRAAALAVLLIALFLPVAHADPTCTDPYCTPNTPNHGSQDCGSTGGTDLTTGAPCDTTTTVPKGESCDEMNGGAANGGTDNTAVCEHGAVSPSESQQTPTGGGSTSGGAAGAEAAPAAASAPAAATAPSGSLPFTGGDVAGMTIIGAAALAMGLVLVNRSKKAKAEA
jgi:hypothetical protein